MLPFLIAGAAAALFGAKVSSAMNTVVKDTQQEAEDTLELARITYDSAKVQLELQQSLTKLDLQVLSQSKHEVLSTSIPEFIEAFSKFKNVDFKDSAGIDEIGNLDIDDFSYLETSDMWELEDLSNNLINGDDSDEAALGAGVLTMVTGFAIAAPVMIVSGFSSYLKADENLEKAKTALIQAEAAASQMETSEFLCEKIGERAEMFSDLLSKLTPLLDKSIIELKKISGNSNTKDFRMLSQEEKQYMFISGAIVKAVKAVIDTPILDSDGDITYESDELCYKYDEDSISELEKSQNKLSRMIASRRGN